MRASIQTNIDVMIEDGGTHICQKRSAALVENNAENHDIETRFTS